MNHHDPFDLEAPERERAIRDERTRNAQRTEADDLKWMMSSKRGRRIIWRLLEQSGVYRLSFSQNAMTMAFNEGNRNFGLALLSKVHELSPESYSTMVQEQKNASRPSSGSGSAPDQ